MLYESYLHVVENTQKIHNPFNKKYAKLNLILMTTLDAALHAVCPSLHNCGLEVHENIAVPCTIAAMVNIVRFVGLLLQKQTHTAISRVHTRPIGLIPKPHCPGKFHLIVDLSAPKGFSVNDGIDFNCK